MFLSIMSIIFIVFSPYLSLLPMLTASFHIIKNRISIKSIWNIGLFSLFVWSIFVGIVNLDIISIMCSFVILCYCFVSTYLQVYFNKEEKIEKLLKNVVIISTFSAFIGLLERVTSIHDIPGLWKYLFGIYPPILFYDRSRISGTFGNPNIAGLWYSAMILISIYFYQNVKGIKKLFYAIFIVLFTSVLIMTKSRGAMFGFLLGMITYTYSKKCKDKTLLIVMLVTFLIIVFDIPNYFLREEQIVSSINNREIIWKNCLNIFKDKPITGCGLMGIYFADEGLWNCFKVFHGHNIFITVITTLGIVGLCIFTFMNLYMYKQIKILSNTNCKVISLLSAIQALIWGQGIVDFTIMSFQGGILFFGCAALIDALAFQYCIDVSIKKVFLLPLLSKIKNKID